MCISDYMQATSFYLGRFLKKFADIQWSTISNIQYILYHGSGLMWNWTLMEVPLCLIFIAYTEFLLCTTDLCVNWNLSKAKFHNYFSISIFELSWSNASTNMYKNSSLETKVFCFLKEQIPFSFPFSFVKWFYICNNASPTWVNHHL